MPKLRLDDGLTMHYELDDFTPPWEQHETVMLIHGFAESGRVWFSWVPRLGKDYRILRPDLRGFGRSSVMPDGANYPWSIKEFADDLAKLLRRLELGPVHIVGMRVGGPIGVQLAADHPKLVRTLSIASGLMRAQHMQGLSQSADGQKMALSTFSGEIARRGKRAFFADTQRSRLGSGMPQEQIDWWTDEMSRTNTGSCIGMMAAAAKLDVYKTLPRVKAPTLVLAARNSKVQSIEATRDWQERITNSELQVMPGDSPHLPGERPDDCTRRVLAFIKQHPAPAPKKGGRGSRT